GWCAKHRQMPVVLEPAHHAVVGDVAEDQVAAVAEINRPFCPAKASGDALDRGIALLVGESRIEPLDTGIRIACIVQIAEWQRHDASMVSSETSCRASLSRVMLRCSILPGDQDAAGRRQPEAAL